MKRAQGVRRAQKRREKSKRVKTLKAQKVAREATQRMWADVKHPPASWRKLLLEELEEEGSLGESAWAGEPTPAHWIDHKTGYACLECGQNLGQVEAWPPPMCEHVFPEECPF